MNITILEKEGYEADDILGTLAKQGEKAGLDVTVLSGDRDLLQIATDVIKVRIPKTHKGTTEVFDYYAKDVKEQYQVTPVEFIDMKALMGDASDNIPGVPQIGEKTAAKIIMEFGSIENAYEHIDEVMPNKARETFREHYDLAVLSKVLATIKLDCELPVGAQNEFSEGKVGDIFTNEVYEKFSELEFKSLLSKYFSEKKIQDAINPIIDSRTSILIAHRLSTILAADEILVIRDGVIAERGVHADLVKAGGTYAELYETQFYRPDEEQE